MQRLRFVVPDYADVTQVLPDPRMSSDRAHVKPCTSSSFRGPEAVCVSLQVNISGIGKLGFMDEPRHTEVRRFLAKKVFSHRRRRWLSKSRISHFERTPCLPTGLPPRQFNGGGIVAHPLPLKYSRRIFWGIPEKDRKQFVQAMNDIGDFVGEAGPNVIAAAERAHWKSLVKLEEYFKGACCSM